MSIKRRRFLQGAGALSGWLPLSGTVTAAGASAAEPFEFENWEQVRQQFDQDYSWRNFAGFLLASRPHMVERDVQYHREQLNRNAPEYLPEVYRLEAEVRGKAADYLGVQPKQISVTANTTMGLATLYNTIRMRPGQEFLVTEHEHYSCRTSIYYRSQRDGLPVNTIRLYDRPETASVDEMLGNLRKNITPKTRVLALSWVHSGSSIKLPAAQVSELVRDINRKRGPNDRLLFCMDGVHGFGVENASFDELGCDFFVAGTHKWIFGPGGTGIMCSRSDALEDISPTIPPFNLANEGGFGANMTPGGFHAFEHRAAVRKAFDFHGLIGKARVTQRVHDLNHYLKTRLDDLPGVELVTPQGNQLSAGFSFFRVPSMPAQSVETQLRARKIIVSAADRDAGPVVRMAPGLMNNEQDIDATLETLATLVRASLA